MISHIWCGVPRFASVDAVRTQCRAARDCPCRSRLIDLHSNTVYFRHNRIRELTAKGYKVSHSNIKTKRRFLPNLCNVTFISDALGRNVRLRVSTNAIKSVDHRGGFDAFMIKAKAAEQSPRALELKRAIEKTAAAAPEAN